MNRPIWKLAAGLAGVVLMVGSAAGHPGSGIVVTAAGVVYFVDNSPPRPEGTGREIVWRLEKNGKLTACSSGGGHWLAMDEGGSFRGVDFGKWFRDGLAPNFNRVMPADFGPGLIVGDGQPFVMGRDGNLYFARGNLELMRLTREGKVTAVMPGMPGEADRRGGIKGLACGPDGSIYVAYPRALQKITIDGRASIVADEIEIAGCARPVDPAMPGPYLRGLAVTAQGIVYAAATNCRRVIRITPDGKVTTVLGSEPWIPTAVAVAGDDIYVLEFSDARATQWRPRVRKVAADGKAVVVAEVPERAE